MDFAGLGDIYEPIVESNSRKTSVSQVHGKRSCIRSIASPVEI